MIKKRISRKLLVRVHGSKSIGLGHVYNMLTLMEKFPNDEILIIMPKNASLGINKFKKMKLKTKIFSSENEFKKILKVFNPNIIFNDVLDTDKSYIDSLKKQKIFVVNFEDLGIGRKSADLVFNPIYFRKNNLKKEFYGEHFACVRNEFRQNIPFKLRKKVKHIVISLGGVDSNNNTEKILKIIFNEQILKNIKITVLLGSGYTSKATLLKTIKKMSLQDYDLNLIEKTDRISKIFLNSDFIISSNGRTIFEIVSLKIPLISLAVNERESKHEFVKKYKIGLFSNFYKNKNELKTLISSMLVYDLRKKFHDEQIFLDLSNGINIVLEKIESEYKNFVTKQE